jgi:hypothetical protein
LGSLDGVVSTRAAWIGAHEVVEVEFRPEALPFDELLDAAIARSCDQRVFALTDAQLTEARLRVGERAQRYSAERDGALRLVAADEQLYYLNRSPLRYLPLTPVQARRVNGALGAGPSSAQSEYERFLSPRQVALAARIDAILRESPDALTELERPDALEKLAAYSVRLERALAPARR